MPSPRISEEKIAAFKAALDRWNGVEFRTELDGVKAVLGLMAGGVGLSVAEEARRAVSTRDEALALLREAVTVFERLPLDARPWTAVATKARILEMLGGERTADSFCPTCSRYNATR